MKGEGVTHDDLVVNLKKRPPDNTSKLNLDNMDSRTGVGKIVDAAWHCDHIFTEENRHSFLFFLTDFVCFICLGFEDPSNH